MTMSDHSRRTACNVWRIRRNSNKHGRHLSQNNYYVNHSARPICTRGCSDSGWIGAETIYADNNEIKESNGIQKTINFDGA